MTWANDLHLSISPLAPSTLPTHGHPRAQPVEHQRNDEVGHLGSGDVVVGVQPPVRQLADQRGQRVSHHPGRGGHHLTALLERDNQGFDFLDGLAEELFHRCQQEQRERPLLQNAKQFRELYEQRRSSYLMASCRIDTTGKDVDGVAVEVACSIGLA